MPDLLSEYDFLVQELRHKHQGRVEKTVLEPESCRELSPDLEDELWVYRYHLPDPGWTLSVATYARPQSNQLSLGGFRIMPRQRVEKLAAAYGTYKNDLEAIGLAIGMEGKVARSRLLRAGGPLGRDHLQRVVGGKCVLLPTDDARIGEPRDVALLDFAAFCLNDLVDTAGIVPITGQDLGHGVMSDGRTHSLRYLHQRFHGSVVADTSLPTAEGNFALLRGAMRAFGVDWQDAAVGFIGCGNVGGHVMEQVAKTGARMLAIETNPARRRALREQFGVEVWDRTEKLAFLAKPMDAVVVNANGGTLDPGAVETIKHNARLKIVCGSENLAMPDSAGELELQAARKLYCHTELCGLFGYLTAVEEYLSKKEKGESFDVVHMVDEMVEAADMLEEPGYAGARRVIERDFAIDLETALVELYG